ncbi:MAG: hypothetical protein ABJN52_16995 [Litorimonas sp.]
MLPDNSPSMTPEAALITAIITQAYRDLFVPVKEGVEPSDEVLRGRDQALAFLTNRTGPFAQHRDHLCSLIGWDGTVLAERITLMLDGVQPFTPMNKEPSERIRRKQEQAIVRLRGDWNGDVRPTCAATCAA